MGPLNIGALVNITHLQYRAVLKVVGARSSLQCTERNASSSQRRDITEVIATDRPSLVVSADQWSDWKTVRLLTGGRVELPRLPAGSLCRTLVDGKTLRPAGVKL